MSISSEVNSSRCAGFRFLERSAYEWPTSLASFFKSSLFKFFFIYALKAFFPVMTSLFGGHSIVFLFTLSVSSVSVKEDFDKAVKSEELLSS